MGYELVKIGFAKNERVFSALNRLGFSMKKAQNLCDKGRILDSSARTLAKNELFSGELFMIDYICYPKGQFLKQAILPCLTSPAAFVRTQMAEIALIICMMRFGIYTGGRLAWRTD